METREELIHKINELRNQIGIINVNVKKLNMDIYNLKKSKLSNNMNDHKPLWEMRKELSEQIKNLAKKKYEMNNLNRKFNLLYNEHNSENISNHGISRRFLSHPTAKIVMKELGYELDKTKSFSENCQIFLCNMVKENRMRELWEKIKTIKDE